MYEDFDALPVLHLSLLCMYLCVVGINLSTVPVLPVKYLLLSHHENQGYSGEGINMYTAMEYKHICCIPS